MILHECPNCDARLESPEDFADHKDQCPLCGQMYVVPKTQPPSWLRRALTPAGATVRRLASEAQQAAAVEALLEATEAAGAGEPDPPQTPGRPQRTWKLSPTAAIIAGGVVGLVAVLATGLIVQHAQRPDTVTTSQPQGKQMAHKRPPVVPSVAPQPTTPKPQPPAPQPATPVEMPKSPAAKNPLPQGQPSGHGGEARSPDMWPNVKPQPRPGEPKPKPQPKPKPKPQPKPKPKPQPKPQPKPEPKPQPKPKPQPEPKPEPKPSYVYRPRQRPKPQPPEKYKPAITLRTGDQSLDMVLVPQGKVRLGSPSGREGEIERDNDEMIHDVILTHPYYIGATEVTQKQFRGVTGKLPDQPIEADDAPVVNVTWDEAIAFCLAVAKKTGRVVRLPTEAQWERACRAGTNTPFYVGQTIRPDKANYNGKYIYGLGSLLDRNFKGTVALRPVRKYPPNPFKLYDMHGNAAEWCLDWYAPYDSGLTTDPFGPDKGTKRVIRGGSWLVPPKRCRSANRDSASPHHKSETIGFRIVLESDPGDLKRP